MIAGQCFLKSRLEQLEPLLRAYLTKAIKNEFGKIKIGSKFISRIEISFTFLSYHIIARFYSVKITYHLCLYYLKQDPLLLFLLGFPRIYSCLSELYKSKTRFSPKSLSHTRKKTAKIKLSIYSYRKTDFTSLFTHRIFFFFYFLWREVKQRYGCSMEG